MPSTSTDRLFGLTTSVAVQAPCRVATTANITLSGEQTIDGVAVVAGDRVLVKSQTDPVANGIYNADAGIWVRAPDFDGSLDAVCGTLIPVNDGTLYADTFWKVATADPFVIGTTSLSIERARLVTEVDVEGLNFVTPQLFGAVGDGTTNDYPAILAAIAYINSLKLAALATYGTQSTIYFSAPKLVVPLAHYYVGSTIEIKTAILHMVFERGAVFKFPADTHGIIIQSHDTTGETTAASTTSGAGSRLENVTVLSAGGSNPAKHGIWMRGTSELINCTAREFPGNGFNLVAGESASGAERGNINTAFFESCGAYRNGRHGFFVDGPDSNAMTFIRCSANNNGRWGIKDSSFLSNIYVGCHSDGNGLVGTSGLTSAPNTVPTLVSHGGNRYACKEGQEAGASTNAPTGAVSSNTWWIYDSAGGASSEIPAWLSGTTYAAGGSYYADEPNAPNIFLGCYEEPNQARAHIGYPSIVSGGQINLNTISSGTHLKNNNGLFSPKNIEIAGQSPAGTITTTLGGSQLANEVSEVLTHSVYAPDGYHKRFVTASYLFPYAYNGDSALAPFSITTPVTTEEFGTGTAQPHILNFGKVGVGLRIHQAGTVAPASGPHAVGEISYRTNGALGGTVADYCITAGTPGTWHPFGIIGAVQCVAQADFAGADLAAVKVELNAFLAKLRTSRLIAT